MNDALDEVKEKVERLSTVASETADALRVLMEIVGGFIVAISEWMDEYGFHGDTESEDGETPAEPSAGS